MAQPLLVFGGGADRRAELHLRVGVEVGRRVERNAAEPPVERAAADASKFAQRLFAARDAAHRAQILGGLAATQVWRVRHERLRVSFGAFQIRSAKAGSDGTKPRRTGR